MLLLNRLLDRQAQGHSRSVDAVASTFFVIERHLRTTSQQLPPDVWRSGRAVFVPGVRFRESGEEAVSLGEPTIECPGSSMIRSADRSVVRAKLRPRLSCGYERWSQCTPSPGNSTLVRAS